MFTITLILYNIAFPLLFVLYFPFYLRHLMKRGEFAHGFLERFGLYSGMKKKQLRALSSPIWVHAVSVGETVAALSFINEWRQREPARHFVLSTTTSTGQQIARDQAPAGVVPIYSPLDFLPSVSRALSLVKPAQLVIFEVELWPNIIRAAARRQIPVSLVNCRMSDHSAAGFARHRWFFRHVLGSLSCIAVQTQEDARRVEKVLGKSDKISIYGNFKFDQVSDQAGGDVNDLLGRVFPETGKDRLIFIAASTHAGEEEIMARATVALQQDYQNFRMILVPRHHERTPEVEATLKAANLDYALLTELRESRDSEPKPVLVVNTTGELLNFLAVSDICFIGKSLGKRKKQQGGHNLIEPAIFGKPIIFGKHMQNFRDVVRIFKANNAALEVANEEEFLEKLRGLVDNEPERQRLGRASRKTVEQQRGAIAKTIALLQSG